MKCQLFVVSGGKGQSLGSFQVETTWFRRLRGLLGTDASADARVLVPCSSIHSVGMRYPIDVAFADKQGRIVLSKRAMMPQSFLSAPKAAFVLERPSSLEPWPLEGEQIYPNSFQKNPGERSHFNAVYREAHAKAESRPSI